VNCLLRIAKRGACYCKRGASTFPFLRLRPSARQLLAPADAGSILADDSFASAGGVLIDVDRLIRDWFASGSDPPAETDR